MRLTLLAVFFALTGLSLHADNGYIVPLTISGTVTVPGPNTDVSTTKGNIKTETFTSSYTSSKITNATILAFLATNYPGIVPNTNYTIVMLYTRTGLMNGLYLAPKGATATTQNTVDLSGYLRPSNSLLLMNRSTTITKTVNPGNVTGVKQKASALDGPTFTYRGTAALNCIYKATFTAPPKSLDFNELMLTSGSFSPLVGTRTVGISTLEIIQLNLVLGKAQAIPDTSVFFSTVNEIP